MSGSNNLSYEWLSKFDSENQRHILAAFSLFGIPSSYLDVGCGTGAMVKIAIALGIDAKGIDILPNEEKYIIKHDLRYPLTTNKNYELVSCIEVVEHIEQRHDDAILQTIYENLNYGGLLIFTSAPPGQGGDGHVNLQSSYYWRQKLSILGLSYSYLNTIRLSMIWNSLYSPLGYLAANVQVFTKGSLSWGALK